ncbi:DUF6273 domain-containing protein [Marinisporobacter balticus]|uniref:DUF6273 domain-containing protein n=1 Tax=Marinisporobacter balticus TaxID=2018667 RepID=A0A4R2KRL8_9FIRM|nr:DUF6273 domain-containing protein [Marinisporobacter balticus]TCO69265.1 hypothetical protein EV214_13342 [Marinisporobacter balticus]
MKKKFVASILCILLISGFMAGCGHQQAIDLKTGDYIQFGKYNDVPILWRVINIDGNGDPLLFSDKIISLKAFDAAGNYHSDECRKGNGSNYWKNSNIRQWLNSDEKANTINWIQNPPSKENMFDGYSPYENEQGFLADENFTVNERNIIKPIIHKSLLDNIDKDKKNGGERMLTLYSKIGSVVQNYDNVYYEMVEDNVFLLSVKELHDYVWKNRRILGKEYYIGKPTKEAVNHSPIKDIKLDAKYNWSYWLRTPSDAPTGPSFVRMVKNDGSIFDYFASFGGRGGIRPALSLNISSAIFQSGSGIKSDPYVAKGVSGEKEW